MNNNSSRFWTLVAMILASGIVFLDSSVINVALPAIEKSLDTGLAGLQWIANSYLLALATLLILGGSLGDRYGRRLVLLVGLIGFGLTSVACGLAPSTPWLTGSPFFQGVSGALLVPGSLAIIRAVYPDGEARGKAIGRWSGWAGITTIIGPLLGGWLVDNLSWRWVFFINVPLVAVTAWLISRYVPESRDEETSPHLDWPGVGVLIVGLGGLIYGLIQGPVLGWSTIPVLTALGVGLIGLVGFPLLEAWVSEPMVPLTLFRSRNFSGANLVTLGVYFALYGTTFFLVIYTQNVLEYSALMAGLMLAPISLILLVLSPWVGKLAGRYGPRLFLAAGPLICSLGLLWLSRLDPGASIWTELIPAISVLGVGLGATVAPLTNTIMSSVEEGYAGLAAAINNAVSRLAALIAIAGLGVVVNATFQTTLAQQTEDLALSPSTTAHLDEVAQNPTGAVNVANLPPRVAEVVDNAYTAAFQRAMIASAALALVGGVVAAILIRNPSSD